MLDVDEIIGIGCEYCAIRKNRKSVDKHGRSAAGKDEITKNKDKTCIYGPNKGKENEDVMSPNPSGTLWLLGQLSETSGPSEPYEP